MTSSLQDDKVQALQSNRRADNYTNEIKTLKSSSSKANVSRAGIDVIYAPSANMKIESFRSLPSAS